MRIKSKKMLLVVLLLFAVITAGVLWAATSIDIIQTSENGINIHPVMKHTTEDRIW